MAPTPPCDPNAPPPLEGPVKSAFDPDEPEEQPHWLFSADYLHWWVHKSTPPLLTSGLGAGATGILQQPGTITLFGANKDSEEHDGGRFTFGYWFDGSPIAVEANLLFLAERANHLEAGSDPNGNPILARPVINALTSQETAFYVSFPNQFSGQVQLSTRTKLFGADANIVMDPGPFSTWKLPNLVVGFKYLDLQEDLNVDQQTTVLAGGVVAFQGEFLGPTTLVSTADTFTTHNQFIGGQVGLRGEQDVGYFFVNVNVDVGAGVTHSIASINGNTTVIGATPTAPPTPINTTVPGGLLALSSNSGRLTHDEFSLVPEGGINFGWHLAKNWDVYLGYSFIYWSQVVRPGQEVDRVINPGFLPTSTLNGSTTTPARPAFTLTNTDFWAHGINLGMAIRF
jgi:hypothetical protein